MNYTANFKIFVLTTFVFISSVSIVGYAQQTKSKVKRSSNKELCVISFNTPYRTDDLKAWDYRKSAIVNMILTEEPAFLGMQEVRYNPQLADLDASLTDYARVGVGRDDGANGGDFSVIYYNKNLFKVLETGNYWMSETPDIPSYGWGANHRRLTTWAIFQMIGTNKKILVSNTHLDHESQKAKEMSIKMMKDSIENHLSKYVNTVIVMGDFNTYFSSPYFDPFKGFLKACREEAPVTNRILTTNNWGNPNGDTAPIDHIFYKNCTPISFEVLTGNYGVELMSDHYPIKAILKL